MPRSKIPNPIKMIKKFLKKKKKEKVRSELLEIRAVPLGAARVCVHSALLLIARGPFMREAKVPLRGEPVRSREKCNLELRNNIIALSSSSSIFRYTLTRWATRTVVETI